MHPAPGQHFGTSRVGGGLGKGGAFLRGHFLNRIIISVASQLVSIPERQGDGREIIVCLSQPLSNKKRHVMIRLKLHITAIGGGGGVQLK